MDLSTYFFFSSPIVHFFGEKKTTFGDVVMKFERNQIWYFDPEINLLCWCMRENTLKGTHSISEILVRPYQLLCKLNDTLSYQYSIICLFYDFFPPSARIANLHLIAEVLELICLCHFILQMTSHFNLNFQFHSTVERAGSQWLKLVNLQMKLSSVILLSTPMKGRIIHCSSFIHCCYC